MSPGMVEYDNLRVACSSTPEVKKETQQILDDYQKDATKLFEQAKAGKYDKTKYSSPEEALLAFENAQGEARDRVINPLLNDFPSEAFKPGQAMTGSAWDPFKNVPITTSNPVDTEKSASAKTAGTAKSPSKSSSTLNTIGSSKGESIVPKLDSASQSGAKPKFDTAKPAPNKEAQFAMFDSGPVPDSVKGMRQTDTPTPATTKSSPAKSAPAPKKESAFSMFESGPLPQSVGGSNSTPKSNTGKASAKPVAKASTVKKPNPQTARPRVATPAEPTKAKTVAPVTLPATPAKPATGK